jgi:hypothetical protein
MTAFWDTVHTATISRVVMEEVHVSETLVYSNETIQHCIPDGSHLHTCCHKNLKSHYYM